MAGSVQAVEIKNIAQREDTVMSALKPFIALLAERLGLPLETDQDGSFMAMLDGKRLLVSELSGSSALLFYMEVGRPTLFRRGEVLGELLAGNLFLAETKGAALSYDELNEMIGLNLILPLHHLEGEEFINVVDNVVAAAEDWGHKLEAFNADAEERARQDGGVSADAPAAPSAGEAQLIRV